MSITARHFKKLTVVVALGTLVVFSGFRLRALSATTTPRVEYLWDTANESVFAYSRISGNGRYLAYSFTELAGEEHGGEHRRLRVVDLQKGVIIHEDVGIDGYWSPDSSRLIYKARRNGEFTVAIWDRATDAVATGIFPVSLGDYYSWGADETGEVVMTIDGWLIPMTGLGASGPPRRMRECPSIGRGARPLISRDGRRASVFVRDELVVRSVDHCDQIVFTGITGAKADWSADGSRLAFHVGTKSIGYQIGVYDLASGRYASVPLRGGSNYFPNWTDDGALVFRRDGQDFKGFVRVVGDFAPSTPPVRSTRIDPVDDVAHTPISRGAQCVVVLLWASWGAHSDDALSAFVEAESRVPSCTFRMSIDPTSDPAVVAAMLRRSNYHGTIGDLDWTEWRRLGGLNQTPTYVFYNHGCLAARVLGAMDANALTRQARQLERITDGECCVDATAGLQQKLPRELRRDTGLTNSAPWRGGLITRE